ncbi:mitochondrial intermembrane space import and assembly protein 40-B-like [Varroa destructor]|uniref:Mitochondrial intermembrane space import and assembly protein 40 n=1 Tax=Varroa destructor TaxID=109461 RepID=A0A7M7JCU4_VARDE|nr:mitochondrial intermembrane space import and assembly protein 40-B-like [Varroa destructor]
MAMTTTEYDFGKDHVVLMTEEDAQVSPKYQLPPTANDEPAGAILANGDINWDCPCLGGMASGPCALEFQDAFSCFHYSKADPQGSECMASFQKMQACIQQYPNLYPVSDDNDEATDKLKYLEDNEGIDDSGTATPTIEQQQEKFVAAAAASQEKQKLN